MYCFGLNIEWRIKIYFKYFWCFKYYLAISNIFTFEYLYIFSNILDNFKITYTF